MPLEPLADPSAAGDGAPQVTSYRAFFSMQDKFKVSVLDNLHINI